MQRLSLNYYAAILVVFAAVSFSAMAADSTPRPYAVVNTLKVGGEGGFDYATLDGDGKLLFLPRTSHTMVVDTATGKVVADFGKLGKGHGVALAPEIGHGFVTDGKNGTVVVFDLKSYEVLGTLAAADDADGIIHDPATHSVLVSCGDAEKMIVIPEAIDPKAGKAGEAIDLGGKPEFLVADGAGMAYVNLADKALVAQVDIKAKKVLAKWSTAPGTDPTGLAIDVQSGRLYVGCRNQKMIVMNTKDGKVLADLPIGRGVDATAFHQGAAFASCGDGTLAVIRESSAGKFEVVQTVKTAAGAKTMALDYKSGNIYLPTADMQPAASGKGRPTPIAGTFKILVVGESK